ncbi:hypothetical protein CWI38_0077p0030 [Hamiltosporidium tvaerminnensis]|nr:hypothetical protein CWI38_0077p0030 [Hamiltosporidium tvaerminnensis]
MKIALNKQKNKNTETFDSLLKITDEIKKRNVSFVSKIKSDLNKIYEEKNAETISLYQSKEEELKKIIKKMKKDVELVLKERKDSLKLLKRKVIEINEKLAEEENKEEIIN